MSEINERDYLIQSLLARAVEVLQDKDEALHWLNTPKKALGGKVPLDLAETQVGADEVKDLLSKIEHGVFT